MAIDCGDFLTLQGNVVVSPNSSGTGGAGGLSGVGTATAGGKLVSIANIGFNWFFSSLANIFYVGTGAGKYLLFMYIRLIIV